MNSFNSKLAESAIKNKLADLLSGLKDFKFIITLVLELKTIQSDDKSIYNTFYSNSKAETIINDDVFESIYTTIISNIQKKYLGKGSGCIIDSVINHNINISKSIP